jgi:hypothetical protein
MKALANLLTALLAVALVITVGAWVIDRTVWNGPYLLQTADRSHLSEELAKALPEAVATSLGGNQADTKTVLAQAITPAYVHGLLESLVPQLEKYYQGSGPVPTLDLRELKARIEAADLPVPASLSPSLEQPIAVATPASPVLTSVATRTHQATWLGPLVAIALIGLIVVAARHRRWLVLAGATLGAAIGCAVLAGVATVPPRLIASSIDTSPIRALTPAVRHYSESVGHDQSHILIVAAIILLLLTVVLGVGHLLAGIMHRLGRRRHAH